MLKSTSQVRISESLTVSWVRTTADARVWISIVTAAQQINSRALGTTSSWLPWRREPITETVERVECWTDIGRREVGRQKYYDG